MRMVIVNFSLSLVSFPDEALGRIGFVEIPLALAHLQDGNTHSLLSWLLAVKHKRVGVNQRR